MDGDESRSYCFGQNTWINNEFTVILIFVKTCEKFKLDEHWAIFLSKYWHSNHDYCFNSCAGPEEYKEKLLDSLATDTKIVNCTNPTDIISGGDNNHGGGSTVRTTSSNKGLIIFSLLGIIAVIGGMACFIMMAVRKSNLREMYDTTSGQIVHYVRTAGVGDKQEDEQAIVKKEYNQYYEEP